MQRILRLDQTAQVLCSSGYADDPVMANFAAYGFRGSLPKPYTIQCLRDAVALSQRNT